MPYLSLIQTEALLTELPSAQFAEISQTDQYLTATLVFLMGGRVHY